MHELSRIGLVEKGIFSFACVAKCGYAGTQSLVNISTNKIIIARLKFCHIVQTLSGEGSSPSPLERGWGEVHAGGVRFPGN